MILAESQHIHVTRSDFFFRRREVRVDYSGLFRVSAATTMLSAGIGGRPLRFRHLRCLMDENLTVQVSPQPWNTCAVRMNEAAVRGVAGSCAHTYCN